MCIAAAGGFPIEFLAATTQCLRIHRILSDHYLALPIAAKHSIDGWDGTNITTVHATDDSRLARAPSRGRCG